MQRLGTSYTKYFNERHDRSGSLFQGTYKAVHVHTNEYFMHLGCYINLNNLVHPKLNPPWLLKQPFSSMAEYCDVGFKGRRLVDTSLLLAQYRGVSDFKKKALQTVHMVEQRKRKLKEYTKLTLD
jgi:putative transposase